MGDFLTMLLTYSFWGAMAVLLIMNAPNTISVGKMVFGGWAKETSLLTGSGYQKPK